MNDLTTDMFLKEMSREISKIVVHYNDGTTREFLPKFPEIISAEQQTNVGEPSAKIKQIVAVLETVRYKFRNTPNADRNSIKTIFTQSVKDVSKSESITYQSVIDKLCRQTGVKSDYFTEYLIPAWLIDDDEEPLYKHLIKNTSERRDIADRAAIEQLFD